eukprot:7421947-Lingulodinium_polyedra.AAC.1
MLATPATRGPGNRFTEETPEVDITNVGLDGEDARRACVQGHEVTHCGRQVAAPGHRPDPRLAGARFAANHVGR